MQILIAESLSVCKVLDLIVNERFVGTRRDLSAFLSELGLKD